MNAVACLYRYPVKGLSPEPLPAVELNVGDGFPLDRRMAITNGAWLFDAQTYEPRPKSSFLMLARDEALAALKTSVNPAGTELTLSAPDGRRIVADIDDDASLDALSDFLQAYLGGRLQGPPRLVRSASHRFTDVSVVSPAMMSSVSLINLASLSELEQAMGRTLDPLRFRANIYFDGGKAWEEHDWLDRDITLGEIRMRVVKRIQRCPATNVDPATGVRDLEVPQALADSFGHRDMGVYAQILRGGVLRPHDKIQVLHEPESRPA